MLLSFRPQVLTFKKREEEEEKPESQSRGTKTESENHDLNQQLPSSKRRPAARADEKWIGERAQVPVRHVYHLMGGGLMHHA